MPLFDEASLPVLNTSSAAAAGVRLRLVYGGQDHPVEAPFIERGAHALLRVTARDVPVGPFELRVDDADGHPLRRFAARWDVAPEARPGLVELRRAVVGLPAAAAVERLEAALPSLAPDDALWLSADIARAWQREDTSRAVGAWTTAADRAAASGSPTEQSRRLRAAAWNALNTHGYAACERLLGLADDLDQPLHNLAGLVRAQITRGMERTALGDLRGATNALTEAAARAWESGLDGDWASATQYLAVVLATQGLHGEAYEAAERLVPYYAAHGQDIDSPRFAANRGWVLLGGIRAGVLQIPIDEARRSLESAVTMFRERGEPAAAVDVLADLASLELQDGRVEVAAARVAEARALDPQHRRFGGLRLWNLEGEVLLARGRAREALALFKGVESRARGEVAIGATEDAWQARFGAGRAHWAIGQRSAARADFAQALQWLEATARGTGILAARSAFVADRRAPYDAAVALSLEMGDVPAALRVVQQAQARSLRALEVRARLDRLSANQQTEWKRRVETWIGARSAFEAGAAEEDLQSPKSLPGWRTARQRQAAALVGETDALNGWLETVAPEPVEAEIDLPAAVGPGAALVTLFQTSGALHGFWVKDGRLHHELLGADPFAQLEARLGDVGHLYVVTAGYPAARDWPLRWVAHGTATLLPSLRSLATPPSPLDRPPLVVADPESNLPHALAEGTMVRSVLGPTAGALFGDVATREALFARWSGSPVLHFAGHGALTEGRPWEARLRLAGGETVTVADILMLRPSLGLVVLSGCDTGRAEALSSLEDVGLSEAFLAAGARTVVATVSPVDDAQAAAFVSGFYANGGALAPAEAWRHLMKSDDPELRAAAASWRVFGRP